MSYRTKIFKLMPWRGGLNVSEDAATIAPNELTRAEGLVFGVNGARNMRDGINFNWDSSTAGGGSNGESIVALYDFWYGSTGAKTNFLMGIGSSGNLYQWNKGTGARTKIPLNSTATTWPAAITTGSLEVINNTMVVAVDGNGNYPRQYAPLISSSATDLSGSPPQMSISREWQGRLFSNDKLNRDRLNYSPPGDVLTWGGNGDSGAIDIAVGDGDPIGLSSLMPPFQGNLFVAKLTKLYRISGYTPETWQITVISDGVGCISHNAAVAVDQDDVIFLSERGIHSLVGTIQFGEIESKYLSKKIQGHINSYWTKSKLPLATGAYLSQINSVAFAVADSAYSGTGINAVWLYNILDQAWYVWPNLDCQSIVSSYDTDKKRFYIGTATGRIGKTFNGTNYDISIAGVNTAITMDIKTGVIFPSDDPMMVSAFKRFTLIWGPLGTVNVTVTITIDNYSPQSLNFVQSSTNNVLGTTFVLGSSVLGLSVITGPYSGSIDGYGRSFQVEITQSGQQASVNIQGIAMEFEPLGPAQETITSG